MSNPPPAPTSIPRKDLARYVTDEKGQPIEKLIQDLEEQQEFTLVGLPAQVAAAQASANAALAELNADAFLVTGGPFAGLPQSRSLVAGTRLTTVDTGAGGTLTLSLSDKNVTLPADVPENAGVFTDATGLLAALAINSVYIVEGLLTFQSAGAGVGIGLGFTLPAGATISGSYNHNATATTLQGAFNTAAGAVNANTTAVPIINVNIPIHGRWIIRTAGTAGNAQLQLRSSAAATTVTLKQDLSTLSFQKIG